MWALLAAFAFGLLVWVLAWWRGYCAGLRRGRAEGRRALVDEARDKFLASVIEHADMEAWEKEL